MNRNGEKVNKAQLKEIERCLLDFQMERLDAQTDFDECTTDDRRGKVDRAEERTETREVRKCDSLDDSPHFAYTGAATVNPAAVDQALALLYAIFGGPPVSEADLVTRAEDKETAKCQLEVLRRAARLENTVLKELNKAKRRALKDEAVDSAAALEAELEAVFSSNRRIDNVRDRFVRRVNKMCAALSPLGAIFAGDCGDGNPDLGEVRECVIAAARCQACLKINAFDDLNMDCDQADDETDNGSCP